MNNIHIIIVMLISSFLITFLVTRKIIPIIASLRVGQKILEDGPVWHKPKEGTPTMGGIAFVLAMIACFGLFVFFMLEEGDNKEIAYALNLIIYALLNSLIGFVDDWSKVRKKQNKGLSAGMKFLLQSLAAIFYLVLLKASVGINTVVTIPFIDFSIDLGIFYYFFAWIILCGFVNAVNLTDGLDGLAASVTLTVGIFFIISSLTVITSPTISFVSATLVGSMMAFLIFNHYPAKVFMGDTGSLFLGALVVGLSFVANNMFLVLAYGFVFFCEALSDILQVGYFKITKGKRIFKMAPLHHHFEKIGWSENKIVVLFSFVNIAFCTLAYIGLII